MRPIKFKVKSKTTLCQLIVPAEGERPALYEGDIVLYNDEEYYIKYHNLSYALVCNCDYCQSSDDEHMQYYLSGIIDDIEHTGRNIHDPKEVTNE